MGRNGLTGVILGVAVFTTFLLIILAVLPAPGDAGGTMKGAVDVTQTSMLTWAFRGFGDLLKAFILAIIPTSCSGV